MNFPTGTVIFQAQVPIPGFFGYPGVLKLLPSPDMCTVVLFLREQVPDEIPLKSECVKYKYILKVLYNHHSTLSR